MLCCAAFALTNFFLFPDFSGIWSVQYRGLSLPVASQQAAMRVEVSFVISELPLRPEPQPVVSQVIRGMLHCCTVSFCPLLPKPIQVGETLHVITNQ